MNYPSPYKLSEDIPKELMGPVYSYVPENKKTNIHYIPRGLSEPAMFLLKMAGIVFVGIGLYVALSERNRANRKIKK